jgi:hypothetical protein
MDNIKSKLARTYAETITKILQKECYTENDLNVLYFCNSRLDKITAQNPLDKIFDLFGGMNDDTDVQ